MINYQPRECTVHRLHIFRESIPFPTITCQILHFIDPLLQELIFTSFSMVNTDLKYASMTIIELYCKIMMNRRSVNKAQKVNHQNLQFSIYEYIGCATHTHRGGGERVRERESDWLTHWVTER